MFAAGVPCERLMLNVPDVTPLQIGVENHGRQGGTSGMTGWDKGLFRFVKVGAPER